MAESGTVSVQLRSDAPGVSAFVERIAEIPWFQQTGMSGENGKVESLVRDLCEPFGFADVRVRQLTASELGTFVEEYNIAGNALWECIKVVPETVQEAAVKSGRTELLSYALRDVPESVFHRAYDGAFARFGTRHEPTLRFAVAAAMLTSGLATGWEVVADIDGVGRNPLLPAVRLFEQGCLPLGLFEGTFYMA